MVGSSICYQLVVAQWLELQVIIMEFYIKKMGLLN